MQQGVARLPLSAWPAGSGGRYTAADSGDCCLELYDAVSHYPRARLALLGEERRRWKISMAAIWTIIDLFDPALFHLSPREAKMHGSPAASAVMATHQALEDAGIREAPNFRRTGVFISHYASQYLAMDRERNAENALFMATGNAALHLRQPHFPIIYDLEGPSLVDRLTACSSSLAGLDLAAVISGTGGCRSCAGGGGEPQPQPRRHTHVTTCQHALAGWPLQNLRQPRQWLCVRRRSSA